RAKQDADFTHGHTRQWIRSANEVNV
ncbi:MAG: hypothetical protein ACJAYX_004650, partial [Planctomycetota bacterium]